MRGPLSLLLFLAVIPAAAQEDLDCTDPVTQVEMTGCAAREWEAADSRLNDIYPDAVAAARARDADLPPGEVTNEEILRDAQRAWIPFRDAACDAESTIARGGTLANQIFYICLTRLTERRIEDLDIYVGGLTGDGTR